MLKIVLIGIVSFICVSTLLANIGYSFNIQWLKPYFYEETEAGFRTGGSMAAMAGGLAVSFLFTHYSYRKQPKSFHHKK
ncbi:hypothetical protein [Bacillus thermotolerans]|uniref:hypothetical protein n=1 Tax=Bacillus thermotolerans TaxID=1221996 RepID=UPI00057FEB5F|nr:hypothetical protein [Bacillus thermotolerans]